MKSQGLEPLEACQKVIHNKIDLTNSLIRTENSVKLGQVDDPTKFTNNASFLGSLPEIPDLKDVPFITFDYESSTVKEVNSILSDFGQVCRIAPIQVRTI